MSKTLTKIVMEKEEKDVSSPKTYQVYLAKPGDVVQIKSDTWYVAVGYTDIQGHECIYWRELTSDEMVEMGD